MNQDLIGWIVFGVIFFGGSVAAFFSGVRDVLMTWAGRGRGLGKPERKELERLRVENGELREALREVQAYDRFATTPLTTELSDKVNRALNPLQVSGRRRRGA